MTIKIALCLLLLTSGSLVLAADDAAKEATRPAGCANSSGSAHDQLISLSKLIDPSGRLTKMIADFHPAHQEANSSKTAENSMPGRDPSKRSTENEQKSTSEQATSKPTTATVTSSATPATTVAEVTSTSATTTIASSSTASSSSSSSTAAPEAASQASPAATTAAPAAAAVTQPPKPTEGGNVTVNVFLQLAPDAKTEEIINNPDKVLSSTTTPAPEVSSTTASSTTTMAPVSSSSPAPSSTAAAASSTQTPATTQATSTTSAPSSVESSTTVGPTPAIIIISTPASESNPIVARSKRAAEAATSAKPAAPSSSTTTTAPAPSTTAAAPSTTSAAPSTTSTSTTTTTTTTTTPPPPPPSSTTTTTTTQAPTSTSTTTTTTAAPKPSSTSATVEISAKDLVNESNKTKESGQTVEIVVSSMPAASSTSAPSTTSAPKVASTAASTTTTTTTTSTTTTPAAVRLVGTSSGAGPDSAGMLIEDMKEIVTRKQTNFVGPVLVEEPLAVLAAPAPPAPVSDQFEHFATTQNNAILILKSTTLAEQPISSATNFNSTNNNNNNLSGSLLSSSAIDNSNVIYDNDTSLSIELPLSKLQKAQQLKDSTTTTTTNPSTPASSTYHHAPSATLKDFLNCDRSEEMEKENFASCFLEPIFGTNNNSISSDVVGRLNFWQPVNNAGVLHLLVRVRYSNQQQQPAAAAEKTNNTPPSLLDNSNNDDDDNGGLKRRLIKRESFRTPIEREPPVPLNSSTSLIGASRHQIWLLDSSDSCDNIRTTTTSSASPNKHSLLAEVSRTTSQDNNRFVDLDAELFVSKFNLTGVNEIVNKHLLLSLPSGQPLACCKVLMTETLPVSELDNLPSVSVVQPTREDLLPDNLKGKPAGQGSSSLASSLSSKVN